MACTCHGWISMSREWVPNWLVWGEGDINCFMEKPKDKHYSKNSYAAQSYK